MNLFLALLILGTLAYVITDTLARSLQGERPNERATPLARDERVRP